MSATLPKETKTDYYDLDGRVIKIESRQNRRGEHTPVAAYVFNTAAKQFEIDNALISELDEAPFATHLTGTALENRLKSLGVT